MNDNELADEIEDSEWVWEIVDKYDLGQRSDQPISAAIVLLTDAAEDLRTLGMTALGAASRSMTMSSNANS